MSKQPRCGQIMVGSGTDTYDPTCDLPPGHPGPCHSVNARDQYRLDARCSLCREFRGLSYHPDTYKEWDTYYPDDTYKGWDTYWDAACWRHRPGGPGKVRLTERNG